MGHAHPRGQGVKRFAQKGLVIAPPPDSRAPEKHSRTSLDHLFFTNIQPQSGWYCNGSATSPEAASDLLEPNASLSPPISLRLPC